MDADVRETDVLRDGSRNDLEAPLRTAHHLDPRTRLLLEGSIAGTLLRLATPNVLVMFVQAAVGLIETYFVAKLGTDALAGVALVFPLLMLMQMMSAGAMGGAIPDSFRPACRSTRCHQWTSCCCRTITTITPMCRV